MPVGRHLPSRGVLAHVAVYHLVMVLMLAVMRVLLDLSRRLDRSRGGDRILGPSPTVSETADGRSRQGAASGQVASGVAEQFLAPGQRPRALLLDVRDEVLPQECRPGVRA